MRDAEDVSFCRLPANRTISLWRYMNFTHFADLLGTRELFFARADRLGAPEGEGGGQEETYACCWHAGDTEAGARWKVYGEEADAIAVVSTYEALRAELPRDQDQPRCVFISEVKYTKNVPESAGDAALYLPHLHKARSFDDEREVRALSRTAGPSDPRFGSKGLRFAVSLEGLVREIHIAPMANTWFVNLVKGQCEKRGLAGRIRAPSPGEASRF